MPISPSSTVHLCSVPLSISQKHQIRFTSESSQYDYFYHRKKKSPTGCKYVKGSDNVYSIPYVKDDIMDCNYIMYRNTAYNDKWYYAFITDMQYINDDTTEITIKSDVYQTWLFDTTLQASHIERAHVNVNDDIVGLIPTTDENLTAGDYVINSKWNIDSGNNLTIIVASTAGAGGVQYEIVKYSNVVSGYTFFAFDNNNVGIAALREWVISLNNDEAIGFMFLVPKYAVPSYENGDPIGQCEANIQTITKPIEFTTIDGYYPKNKKLHMYPYSFLYASTHNGVSAVYKYEQFDTVWNDNKSTLNFTLCANLAVEPRVLVAPRAYKGASPNYDEAIILDGFPQCSWVTDFYKSWLATNGLSQALSIFGGGVTTVASAVTGNPVGVAMGAAQIANSIGSFAVAAAMPDQAKGSNKGSINAALGLLNITFYQKTIDRHHAEIIDDYFEKYGYKINKIAYIPVRTRKYYNYIKTIDIGITGNVPAAEMDELKSLYDNGITLWHYPEYYLNYTKNNHEVII